LKRKTPQLDKLLDRLTDLTGVPGGKSGLARAIGITPQQLNDWFSGRCKPNGEMTLRLLSWVIARELEQDGNLDHALSLLLPIAKKGR
jgi:hypothetical protein